MKVKEIAIAIIRVYGYTMYEHHAAHWVIDFYKQFYPKPKGTSFIAGG